MEISALGDISSAVDSATSGNVMGKDDFLNLLLKQLEHQDPLNPMDNTEFTSQLTQFSTLEELNNISKTLDNVLAYQQSMQNAAVTNMIGKTVNVDGNSTYLNDTAELNYTLADDASVVKITIKDADGKIVWSKDIGSQTAGAQQYLWDGKDLSGNEFPKGSYTFDVEAQDISGNQVQAATTASGTVSSILFEDGITYLTLNSGIQVNLSDIQTIE